MEDFEIIRQERELYFHSYVSQWFFSN